VVAISPDGSRVYFVARGALSTGPNAEGRTPTPGADNLYVEETSSGFSPVFITELCSGPETSGRVSDSRCPASLSPGNRGDEGLWETSAPSQIAGDGRFLLFASYGRLLPNDTDSAQDIYLYEAATGTLRRVSQGENGADANGNNDQFNASINADAAVGSSLSSAQAGLFDRSIDEAGDRVIFTSAEPLSTNVPQGNTTENVYEWHREAGRGEGTVALVGFGTAQSGEPEAAVISPSGNDIFFETYQGLVPQDTDGANDIYDARLGGGFPPAPAPRQPCSSDACQGPLSTPPPLLVPGSTSQPAGDNIAPTPAATVKPKPKKKRKPKKKPQKHSRKRKVHKARASGASNRLGGHQR
jgi:hypothetical protein